MFGLAVSATLLAGADEVIEESGTGTNPPIRNVRSRGAIVGDKWADNISSIRVLRILTPNGRWAYCSLGTSRVRHRRNLQAASITFRRKATTGLICPRKNMPTRIRCSFRSRRYKGITRSSDANPFP